jgi:CheY-like chemotaxis protein
MDTYVGRLDSFLTTYRNEVIVALALVVLIEAVIIWLWASRVSALRQRLADAEAAAGTAATAAAAALAVDGLRQSERPEGAAEPRLRQAAAAPLPAMPAVDPAPPSATAPAAFTLPPLARPASGAATAAGTQVPAPVPSASPLATAAALQAAAAPLEPGSASAGMAGWTTEAADQLAPIPLAEGLAPALGGVAAWTESPAVDRAAPPWGQAAAADPVPAAQSVNLLLVEDDVNVAKLYRLLLESRGYTVRHASDGIEGLDAARGERPDLILLDVMMPRMNGITFLQALRDDSTLGAVPVVVLSNFREPRLVERAMALGALEYMVKAQTRPETLVGAIPHWLRGERVVSA